MTLERSRLELCEGDVAEQDTDAIVTAAHWDLAGGQGTDGSVNAKAGRELLDECRRIGGCPIGGAVITGGYALRARYVIHAVGPVWDNGRMHEAEWLALTYESALRLASERGLHSVSFPSLSTGAFGYPMRLAAPVAMRAILGFLSDRTHGIELVRMVLYPRESPHAYALYERPLREELRRRSERS